MPFGVLVLLTGALTLVFGTGETSDFWVDALQVWWRLASEPSTVGSAGWWSIWTTARRTRGGAGSSSARLVQFADWSGLVLRLVYYPPYHSKYNPIERCWSSLERKWNGVLLNCWEIIRACALRMLWRGRHPTVECLTGTYPKKVSVPEAEMKGYNARLQRSATLPK